MSMTSLLTFGQTSFSYLVSTPEDERIFDGAEDEMGNFIMVGRKVSKNPFSESAYLLVLNADGQKVYENDFSIADSSTYFSNVYYRNDSIFIFGAKGSASDHLMEELWLLILDDNYNIIRNLSFQLAGYNIIDLESIINNDGNFLLCGIVDQLGDPDIFFYEISTSGDGVNHAIITLEGNQFEFDLIEKKSGGYKVFANGIFPGTSYTIANIVEFDLLFNFLSADSVPYRLHANHSAKWLNESIYLVTGNKFSNNPSHRDIGIIKLKENNDLILGNHYGKIDDTISYVGACSNLAILNPNCILFGGASNIFPEHLIYQPEDSWLFLNNLDSNLNLNWQRFYGGDAFYYLWGLKATQDGGCLMMATRYDTAFQDQELDIYILKVDSQGVLTSTGDDLSIPIQQLAIFPNPANDFITVRYPDIFGNNSKAITLYNNLCNPIKQIQATQSISETKIDVNDLPIGIYFVVLRVEGKIVTTGKLIVN